MNRGNRNFESESNISDNHGSHDTNSSESSQLEGRRSQRNEASDIGRTIRIEQNNSPRGADHLISEITQQGSEVGTTENNSIEQDSTFNDTAPRDNRQEESIFDRFFDTIIGARRGRRTSSANSNLESSTSREESAGHRQNEQDRLTNPENERGQLNADGNSGAIIITVNYVFSDDNNPQSPNRSGSLVLTLPNNASNRDPRFIQEFIRLATQMAYSTIINGINKSKGIPLDKFNSFEQVPLELLTENVNSCPICFESYLHGSSKVAENETKDHSISKKRKLNTESALHIASASSGASSMPEDTATNVNTTASPQKVKLLADYVGEFDHIPIKMPCGHIFGKSCLFEWLKTHNTCPLCRDYVNEDAQSESPSATTPSSSQPSNPNFRIISHPIQLNDFFNSLTRLGGAQADSSTSTENTSESNDRSSLPSNIGQSQSSEDTSPQDRSSNNAGVFSSLLTYLRNGPSDNTNSLFPFGLSSVRTPSGVETRTTGPMGFDDRTEPQIGLPNVINNSENINVNNDSTGATSTLGNNSANASNDSGDASASTVSSNAADNGNDVA